MNAYVAPAVIEQREFVFETKKSNKKPGGPKKPGKPGKKR